MNYQPEEKPKLNGAEIKVVGDYLKYVILSTGTALRRSRVRRR